MNATETDHDARRASTFGAADWLSLAAAPTFAVMALATGMLGDGGMICSAGIEASPFAGMVWMYLLMSAFHTVPWLKLITRRRASFHRADQPRRQEN